MKKNYTYLLTFLICVCFLCCKKKGLPAPTTSGENTFGCKINGEDWKPRKKDNDPFGINGQPLNVRYNPITMSLKISASDMEERERVYFSVLNPYENDNFHINKNGASQLLHFAPCTSHRLDTTQIHEVFLTRFDQEERIVSGTFQFTAIGEDDCTDTIQVTDGRFDLYYTLQ